MSFKIAISAGHCLTTAGKRLPKKLDPKQTREWVLNDRVSRYQEEAALQYEGVEVLRLDNRDGSKGNDNTKRAKKATEWGANVLIDNHHNAGAKLTKAGGIVAFSYKNKTKGAELRDAVYAACIAAGGLRGNRATPKKAKAYTILKKFNGVGVLMEYGFMDSKADAPVILTDAYAKKMGYASIEAVAKMYGLKKKTNTPIVKEEVCNVELKVLKKGDKNDQVESMQILLLGHGVKMENNGKVYGADGSFGGATVNGVKAFQKKRGLPQTGQCDAKTWAALLGVK